METTSRLLARTLAGLNHRVTVLTGTPPAPDAELFEGYEIVRSATFLDCLAAARHSDLMISKGGVSLLAGSAALLFRNPLIVWHEMFGPVGQGTTLPGSVRLAPLRQAVSRFATLHVAVSEACLRSKGFPEGFRTRVIYNPISPGLARAADAATTQSRTRRSFDYDVLFVGRLIRSKGIYVLADALQHLAAQGARVKACIVGDGPEAGPLQERFQNLPVVFTGLLTHERLASVYQQSRCLVLPSLEPEGMGMVLVEAFAFGTPVIGSDQTGMSEIIGNAGITSPAGDGKALAARIQRLAMSEPRHWQEFSGKALERARRFASSIYVNQIQELIATFGAGPERA